MQSSTEHTFVTVVLVVAAAEEEFAACDAGTVTVTFGISDNCTAIISIISINRLTDEIMKFRKKVADINHESREQKQSRHVKMLATKSVISP